MLSILPVVYECLKKNNTNSQPADKASKPSALPFEISPNTLQNVRAVRNIPAFISSLVLEVVSFMSCCRDLHVRAQSSKAKIPDFLIKGQLDADTLSLDKPMTGELTVKHCSIEIKSIELQLVRVETTAYAEGEVREGITPEFLATVRHFLSWSRFCPILIHPATEIQNIQLVDGNICSDLVIPIYMVFPRLFTCSSLATRNFKVEFEANLVVQFADGHMVWNHGRSSNFP